MMLEPSYCVFLLLMSFCVITAVKNKQGLGFNIQQIMSIPINPFNKPSLFHTLLILFLYWDNVYENQSYLKKKRLRKVIVQQKKLFNVYICTISVETLCGVISELPNKKVLNQKFLLVKLKSSLGWLLWNIGVTNDHGYVPLDVSTFRSFPPSLLITGFVSRLSQRMP